MLLFCRRRAFLLEAADGRTQPSSQGLFQPELIVPQRVHGLPLWIQRNMVTRHAFTLGFLGNEVGKKAFVARMRSRGLAEIDAGERILKAPGGRLGSAHRTPIASLLQECELELKSFKKVALILRHGMPPPGSLPPNNGRSARASIFDTQYIKNDQDFGRKETRKVREKWLVADPLRSLR